MVKKLRELARKFKLRPETLFIAIDFMDNFMATFPDVDREFTRPTFQASLLLTSLLLGAKTDELDDYIPYIKHLQ